MGDLHRYVALTALLLALAPPAHAQSPRLRTFTTAHDFIGSADLSAGAAVVAPGSNLVRTRRQRLSHDNSSLRLPTTASAVASPNLVRPDVTVDSSEPGYTTAPITNGMTAVPGDFSGYVWRSQDAAFQHFVDVAFRDGEREVTSLTIVWGVAGPPTLYKIQVAGDDGWLDDATGWLSGSPSGNSHIFVGSISTRRIRVVQDQGGGPPSQPNVMTVAELIVSTSTGAPLFPVSVDSNFFGYVPSFIADGDTREGAAAEFWTVVWVSENTAAQHWVEVDLGGSKRVAQADVYWGLWGSARFKIQYWNGTAFADTSSSIGRWLDGEAGQTVSRVQFAPVTTTRMRVLQDSNGGRPPPGDPGFRVGLMSVAELELHSAATYTPNLLSAGVDSSSPNYSPGPLLDTIHTATCAPGTCDFPGQVWVSADTPAEHWVELDLGQLMFVGRLRIDWGAWGSDEFSVSAWNGTSWDERYASSVSSNGLVQATIGVYTDRIRIAQPAGSGGGHPVHGPAPNLMSIGELELDGYRATARYVSPPTRTSDPVAQVTLSASQVVTGSQSAAYAVSTDDGATWTSVLPAAPTNVPPGDLVRWRVDLGSNGASTPEISSVQLALTGAPSEIGPALWRGGRAGAISIGVDDTLPTLLLPSDSLDVAGFQGTSYLNGSAIPWWAWAHEVASHTLRHGCAQSPPDGALGLPGAPDYEAGSLLAELTFQLDAFGPLLAPRGGVQSLAWPCGNYELSKGSLAHRFFVSSRGFRDGDPGETALCGPGGWACAHPEGEPMELVEEPTPRNFQNLKAIAADMFRWPELEDTKDTIDWAESQGDWVNLVYHVFADYNPYHEEVEAMVGRDVWVAPQGEVARYIRLRDSFTWQTVGTSPSSREFLVATNLTPLDVPQDSYALESYPLGEVVERVFDGGVTARVHSPASRGTPLRALVWGNGAVLEQREIEANPYLLFDTQLLPAPTQIWVDWIGAGDADLDGVPNAADNCAYRANPGQEDAGGVAVAFPNRVGNRCECGDVTNDGSVNAADVATLRAALASGAALGGEAGAKCSVIDGAGTTCDAADLTALRRRLQTRPLLPGTRPLCLAARP